MQFRDYYEILEVPRTATEAEIRTAFKKLARKYHPDLHTDEQEKKDAEEKFKEINEAHAVLRDPEKRRKYDQLGVDWKQGQDFRPPPGWDVRFDFGSGSGGRQQAHYWNSGTSGFSDFFETLFGGRFQQGFQGSESGQPFVWQQKGRDHEAVIRISLEDAYQGGTKSITLQTQEFDESGRIATREKRYDVKIPAGILPGQKIRLAGQGGEGTGGAERGDLYMTVDVAPHPRYRLEGRDMYMDLPVSAWEAALGTEVKMSTLAGSVTLKIPAGTQGGQRLRLKGKGMPDSRGSWGDLYAVIQIKVPKKLSKKEKRIYEELREASSFDPRS